MNNSDIYDLLSKDIENARVLLKASMETVADMLGIGQEEFEGRVMEKYKINTGIDFLTNISCGDVVLTKYCRDGSGQVWQAKEGIIE